MSAKCAQKVVNRKTTDQHAGVEGHYRPFGNSE